MNQSIETTRPIVGEFYQVHNDLIEVRAVSENHVVCDQERVFTRAEFSQALVNE